MNQDWGWERNREDRSRIRVIWPNDFYPFTIESPKELDLFICREFLIAINHTWSCYCKTTKPLDILQIINSLQQNVFLVMKIFVTKCLHFVAYNIWPNLTLPTCNLKIFTFLTWGWLYSYTVKTHLTLFYHKNTFLRLKYNIKRIKRLYRKHQNLTLIKLTTMNWRTMWGTKYYIYFIFLSSKVFFNGKEWGEVQISKRANIG